MRGQYLPGQEITHGCSTSCENTTQQKTLDTAKDGSCQNIQEDRTRHCKYSWPIRTHLFYKQCYINWVIKRHYRENIDMTHQIWPIRRQHDPSQFNMDWPIRTQHWLEETTQKSHLQRFVWRGRLSWTEAGHREDDESCMYWVLLTVFWYHPD